MRATDGGKAPPGRRAETVLKHRGPHYLCPQCRDINPLHLNARRVHAPRIPLAVLSVAARREASKRREENRRKEEEGEEGGGNTKVRPHFTSPCIRGPRLTSCARRVVPLVLEFSAGQVAFEWVVFRIRWTRSNSTGIFYLP